MSKEYEAEGSSDAKKIPRRVEFVKDRTAARVRQEETETVMTVPNLVVREIIAFMILVIVLSLLSLFFNAPLEWEANPQHTPNPAKAPWYFLGLQELLHYFPPIVAGVILPMLVVLALVAIPYFNVNLKQEGMWKQHRPQTLVVALITIGAMCIVLLIFDVYAMLVPTLVMTVLMLIPYFVHSEKGFIGWLGTRPVQWWIMTWFVLIVVVLTAIGTLFRGPEWSWTWPWEHIY
ncbi:MAG: hypothetical protein Q8916_04450 [Bacteroidota bacterium]|nr:hypothetical protein [Bacteroidota bacterium]MDP4234905.1 hypothetical protein [Bacteroidota bacterium]